jgi:4-hydroxy-3-methylbut-2-enyl diphosphate reductase
MATSEGWLPTERPLTVLLTAGASCPDILLDQVMERLCSWQSGCREVEDVLAPFNALS